MAKKTIKIDEKFVEDVKELISISTKIEALTTAQEEYKNSIKEYSITEWAKVYKNEKTNPKTIEFNYCDEKETISYTLTPKESSAKLTTNNANKIIKEYGKEVLKSDTVYKIDNKFLEKNFDTLMELLNKNVDKFKMEDITMEEVITSEQVYKLNKSLDSIGRLMEKNKDIDTMISDFNPTFAIGGFIKEKN